MGKPEALEIVHGFLRSAEKTRIRPEHAPLAITSVEELFDPEGWVFHINTQKFLETKRVEDQIIGPGPIVVLADGRLLEGSSWESADMVLDRFNVSRCSSVGERE